MRVVGPFLTSSKLPCSVVHLMHQFLHYLRILLHDRRYRQSADSYTTKYYDILDYYESMRLVISKRLLSLFRASVKVSLPYRPRQGLMLSTFDLVCNDSQEHRRGRQRRESIQLAVRRHRGAEQPLEPEPARVGRRRLVCRAILLRRPGLPVAVRGRRRRLPAAEAAAAGRGLAAPVRRRQARPRPPRP